MSDGETEIEPSSEGSGGFFECARLFDAKWGSLIGIVLTFFGVIGGAIWAVKQFRESQRNDRVARTMEYIQRYEDGSVATARRNINDVIRPFNKSITQQATRPTQDGYDALINAMIFQPSKSGVRDGIKENDIDIMVDFYEGMFVCVQSGLCEQDTAIAYFGGDESCNFKKTFGKYLIDRKVENPGYAKGLFWFSAGGGKADVCL